MCGIFLFSSIARAQSPAAAVSQSSRVSSVATFLAGGAVALVAHEAGHVIADAAFGSTIGAKKVSFAGIPFFAITHSGLSPAREFVVSSAGFWMQELTDEILLTRTPAVRHAHEPFVKGVLAFNTLASAAYAGAAFSRTGPAERDTRGMAATGRLDERWIGAVVLTPAALDAARYYKPEMRWLRWASRASKVAGALIVLRAAN
jgi:hypothetical protein